MKKLIIILFCFCTFLAGCAIPANKQEIRSQEKCATGKYPDACVEKSRLYSVRKNRESIFTYLLAAVIGITLGVMLSSGGDEDEEY